MGIRLRNGEQILKHSLGPYIKSKINVINGTFYLSNQRFIFAKHSFWDYMLFGIFTQFIKASKIYFEIELNNIVKVELIKGYYNIYTIDKCYKVGFTQNSKKWLNFIIDAIKENTSCSVEEINDGFLIKQV